MGRGIRDRQGHNINSPQKLKTKNQATRVQTKMIHTKCARGEIVFKMAVNYQR